MNQLLLFALVIGFDFINLLSKTPEERVSVRGGLCSFYNLYFAIMATFVWRGQDMTDCALTYFIADTVICKYFNELPTWVLGHHIIATILLTLVKMNFMKWSDLTAQDTLLYFELSTIILDMYEMGIINKYLYDIVFPAVFVGSRLVVFNYVVFSQYITIPMNYDKLIMLLPLAVLNLMNDFITEKIYETSIYNLNNIYIDEYNIYD